MKQLEMWNSTVLLSNRHATATHDLLMKEVRKLFRKYCKDNEVEDIEAAYQNWSADLNEQTQSEPYNLWRALWQFYDDNDPGTWIRKDIMRHVK